MDNFPRTFISYSRNEDKLFVKKLYENLLSKGIHVWWDSVYLSQANQDIFATIKEAVRNTDHMIIVLGIKAVQSPFVTMEWQYALSYSKNITIIRRTKNVAIPAPLSDCEFIDYTSDSHDNTALNKLLNLIKK